MARRRAVATITVLAAATSLAFGGCSSKSKDAAKDVTVSACKADAGGGKPTADGQVHNNSGKDSSYAFRVEFSDGSANKVSDGAVTLGKVKKGETADWHATGATGAIGQLTCKASAVTRTVAP